MSYSHPITSLVAGELSPKMLARWDSAVYQQGVQQLENWLAFPQGGATLRPGTTWVNDLGHDARIIPFVSSSTEAYLVELYPSYLRVWRDGVMRQDMTTSWTTMAMCREVTFAQVENSLVLCHPSTPPKSLIRTALDTFEESAGALPDMTFNGPGLASTVSVAAWAISTAYEAGAIVKANYNYYYCLTAGTSASSGLGPTGQTATEAAPLSDGTCTWRWLQEVPFHAAVLGVGYYPSCVAHFQGRLWFASSAAFPARIWASQVFDYGNLFYFDTVSYSTQQLKNPMAWVTSGTAGAGFIGSLGGVPTSFLLTDTGAYYAQRAGSSRAYIVTTWDGTTVSIMGTTDAADRVAGATWTFSHWQNAGTPEYAAITVRRDLVQPSNAIMMELGSDQCDEIQWLATAKALVVGTATSEWVIPPDATATSPQALLQTRYGSSGAQGTLVNDAVLFLQPNRKRLREYFYRNESGAYESPDLTFYSDHILGTSGATAVDFSQVPLPVIWCLRSDGVVAACLYDKQSGARAWSRFVLGGTATVVSTAVIPDTSTGDDQLWLVVSRAAGYTLEKLGQPWSGYHMDCGGSVAAGAAASTIAVGTRFTSTGVSIYDPSTGTLYPNVSVNGAGNATVAAAWSSRTVYYGHSFTATVTSMPLAPNAQGQAREARAVYATFRVLSSYGFSAGPAATPSAVTPETVPFTGDLKVPLQVGTSTQPVVVARATAAPVTLIGIFVDIDVPSPAAVR